MTGIVPTQAMIKQGQCPCNRQHSKKKAEERKTEEKPSVSTPKSSQGTWDVVPYDVEHVMYIFSVPHEVFDFIVPTYNNVLFYIRTNVLNVLEK